MVRIDSRQLRSVAGDSAGPRHPARRGCLPAAHRHPGLPARRQCRRACAHPRHPAAPHARWPVLPAGQRHRRLAPARSNRAPSRRRVHRPLSCRPKQGLLQDGTVLTSCPPMRTCAVNSSAHTCPDRPWQTRWSHSHRATGCQVLTGHDGGVYAVAVGTLPDGTRSSSAAALTRASCWISGARRRLGNLQPAVRLSAQLRCPVRTQNYTCAVEA
jgi:hypothetical protein